MKHTHEIRDPIHTFIRVSSEERRVIDSPAFQRLRNIHQLATTFLLYPGATHRRFEHSLGVMELASRVFDVVTMKENVLNDDVDRILPQDDHQRHYWRQTVRIAALLHDVGHLPFSHAGEEKLLPEGWDHERLTYNIICSNQIAPLLDNLKLNAPDVARLAVGPKKYKEYAPGNSVFSDWEAILSEIITGDAFGVDRMDYLLRDSHHAGVGYGRFDHHRLIDSLRILPFTRDESLEPALGVDQGGIHGAEALLLARYFMFTQLYFHPVRRIYDIHLLDFLSQWLKGGQFSTKVDKHLEMTDNEVMAAILSAARKPAAAGHDSARRITLREHFRLLYERNPNDVKVNPEAVEAIHAAAQNEFGEQNVRCDVIPAKTKGYQFPVVTHDRRIVSSLDISDTLNKIPPATVGYVFIDPVVREKAHQWLESNRNTIIKEPAGEGDNETATT
ncbi:MAG: HD domain-containing protein [Candidatus Hydrogenedentes bacterium]|nr:HD domain-containing protein [Candidatus Hydrogenedentota bacterium]